MPDMLAIEAKSFYHPWNENEFLRVLRQRNCIGMVAECGDKVVGHFLYELHKKKIQVLDLAVDPEFRRRGVGTQIINKLKGKLTNGRRSAIEMLVRESNLDAHLFLRECGFFASQVIRDHYDDTGEDAYRFGYELPLENTVLPEFLRASGVKP
jgi:[ribosomal protein S18]-alanine N-acetyltransferase